ncbi:cation transporter dimerization domain-containing protein [Paenibacillus elgii]|uniref:cation transporter dimerization domain-containing protein n=1 Tax=Paenibacillus elgii TaxID=189691 RepID=UPI0013D50253|nr:cation transporter dimerization domain-containing protein [Paenibacillus elgii]
MGKICDIKKFKITILKLAIPMGKASVGVSMEKNVESDKMSAFVNLVQSIPEVKRIDRIRVREHGHYIIIDVRVGIPADLGVQEGHDISRSIKHAIMNQYPEVEKVIVHLIHGTKKGVTSRGFHVQQVNRITDNDQNRTPACGQPSIVSKRDVRGWIWFHSEAWVNNDRVLRRQPIEEVSIGEVMIIKPGEEIPFDGTHLGKLSTGTSFSLGPLSCQTNWLQLLRDNTSSL